MNETVCIYRSLLRSEAEQIAALLESNDIPCYVKSDDAGGMLPYLTAQQGIAIFVSKEQQSIAQTLINRTTLS